MLLPKTQVNMKESNIIANAEGFNLRGKCKMEIKDYMGAQHDFTMALKLDKNDKKKQAEHLSIFQLDK